MKKRVLSLLTAVLLLVGCVFTANADNSVEFDDLVGQDKPAAPVAKVDVNGAAVEISWTASQNAVSYTVSLEQFTSANKWTSTTLVENTTELQYSANLADGCYRVVVAAYNGIKENSSEYVYFGVSTMKGDLTCNGVVTDADAIYLLRHVTLNYPLNQSGDFNKDGKVTDADAVYLLRYTLFPEKYPIS